MQMMHSPKARQTEMSVLDIYKLNTGVNLDSQRFINKYTKEDIDHFFKNLVAGNLHQNIILIDNKKAFKNNPLAELCLNGDYSVMDGQHRIEFIRKIISNEIPVEGIFWKDIPQGAKDIVTNTKLPVRIIEQIEYENRGNVFVANNSGNPVSKQDLLTMQNTNTGNFIVEKVKQSKDIFAEMYGPMNHQRRWDKALRIAMQVMYGEMKETKSGKIKDTKISYDYGYDSALEFYKTFKMNKMTEYWVEAYIDWMMLSTTSIPSKLKKRHASNGAFVLRVIKNLGWEINGLESLEKIFSDYVDWEKRQHDKVITIKNTGTLPYIEAVSNVGSKYYKFRKYAISEFFNQYYSEWKQNDLIY